MIMVLKDTTISLMNALGKQQIPFLFILPFEGNEVVVQPLKDVDKEQIQYLFNGKGNVESVQNSASQKPVSLTFEPYDASSYQKQFEQVQQELHYGNSYLLNLTVATALKGALDFETIFNEAKARYKLLVKDQFCCFSPEIFVQIKENRIYAYPMKGTIDGELENAATLLLQDEKETAEHYTIVDLIRNDLNLVSKKVRVDKFRYLEKIHKQEGSILQMSSQISGELNSDWNAHIGTIFSKLVPAGSITGAPKERTLRILKEVEPVSRGYYTGVAGIFDGYEVDSGVLIRFIENQSGQFYYKSGGGITTQSKWYQEYDELLKKIYIPT